MVNLILVSVLAFASPISALGSPSKRFFIEGDGRVHFVNAYAGVSGAVTYKTSAGEYSTSAQRTINRIFGVPANSSETIAFRLIALLDYLQDQMRGGPIKIVSGYRSPVYNEALRSQGRLAARTSMHMEAMAADIEMRGVPAKKLWEFVRRLNCCGAGYYHSNHVHIDVGPSRFWDEATTGIGNNPGRKNHLILVRTDWDTYQPGGPVRMVLGRVTDYPIDVRRDVQLVIDGREITPVRLENGRDECFSVSNRDTARALAWKVPPGIAAGDKFRVRMTFCQNPYPEMPESIESNVIAIR
jgi:uncharacterized protein YcbK (DUF882 family)